MAKKNKKSKKAGSDVENEEGSAPKEGKKGKKGKKGKHKVPEVPPPPPEPFHPEFPHLPVNYTPLVPGIPGIPSCFNPKAPGYPKFPPKYVVRIPPPPDEPPKVVVKIVAKKKEQKSAKQMSKQEKKAARKAELERLREEAKKLEEERLKLEAIEVKRFEEEMIIAWTLEEQRLKEEAERIKCEHESLEPFYKAKKEGMEQTENETSQKSEWYRYLYSTMLPYATDEGSVHSFLDVMAASFDTSLSSAIATSMNIHRVFRETEELALIEDMKGNKDLAKKYKSHLVRLEDVFQVRLDATYAFLLLDSFQVYRETQEQASSCRTEDWKLALWVNHSKNARFRVLDLPELPMVLNLPKQFALSVCSVRLRQSLLHKELVIKSKNVYMSVGGVFLLEVLSIPQPPKAVRAWIMRHVTPLSDHVVELGYPIPLAGTTAPSAKDLSQPVPPISVSLVIPDFVLVSSSTPEIGWWDEKESVWKTEGLTEVAFDQATRKLSFQTIKSYPTAIIQNRVKLFPYTSWLFIPTCKGGARFTLTTNAMAIVIELGAGWCTLIEPQNPALARLYGQKLNPVVLLKQLSISGIHLLPDEEDSFYVSNRLKEDFVEQYAYRDMGVAVPSFAIASTRFNSQADIDTCVIRVMEVAEPCFPPNFYKSKAIRFLMYKNKGCVLINLDEKKSTTYAEDCISEYHASVIQTLEDGSAEESIPRIVEGGHYGVMQTVRDLAHVLRLLSFTA